MNPNDIKERITKRTKLIIITSPQNPTGSVMTTVTCPNATSYTWQRTSGSLSFYASGANMSFTMVSGVSVSFKITARNSSYQVIGTRNVSYYNYGSYMVYPNPVNSTFDIDVVDDLELDIVVYDENMNLKKQIKGYKARSGINVIDWQDGDYVIHIYRGKNRVREQKIKVLN